MLLFSSITHVLATQRTLSMRPYCNQCQYPEVTCICDDITVSTSPIDIVIIQHRKEHSHAKNTARLVSLVLKNAVTTFTDDEEAMTALAQRYTESNAALIYPHSNSTPLESTSKDDRGHLQTLIFIDGSWKQAYGIVKSFPWLEALPMFHFENAPRSNYRIRHTSVNNALSTLEAVAYSLECLCHSDVTNLYSAQEAMQRHFKSPAQHHRK